jgi:hypothetical protein
MHIIHIINVQTHMDIELLQFSDPILRSARLLGGCTRVAGNDGNANGGRVEGQESFIR